MSVPTVQSPPVVSMPGLSALLIASRRLQSPAHPEVQEAIDDAITHIIMAGNAAGILSTGETLARRYLSMGCTFVAVGFDTMLLVDATDRLAKKFKSSDR